MRILILAAMPLLFAPVVSFSAAKLDKVEVNQIANVVTIDNNPTDSLTIETKPVGEPYFGNTIVTYADPKREVYEQITFSQTEILKMKEAIANFDADKNAGGAGLIRGLCGLLLVGLGASNFGADIIYMIGVLIEHIPSYFVGHSFDPIANVATIAGGFYSLHRADKAANVATSKNAAAKLTLQAVENSFSTITTTRASKEEIFRYLKTFAAKSKK